MKISFDPMPARRIGAAQQINSYFANCLPALAQRALAHRRKAEQAARVAAGETPSASFAAEAALRGLDAAGFAALIQAKAGAADALDELELSRQRALLAIDTATTPAELEDILKNLGGQ